MFRILPIIYIIYSLLGCTSCAGYTPEDWESVVPPIDYDGSLEYLLSSFLDDADERNIPVDSRSLRVMRYAPCDSDNGDKYENVCSDKSWGVCMTYTKTLTRGGTHRQYEWGEIYFNPTVDFTDDLLLEVAYHEFGHCLLNINGHKSGTIMGAYAYPTEYSPEVWKAMVDELFEMRNQNLPEP
jgi:hypothetical protein